MKRKLILFVLGSSLLLANNETILEKYKNLAKITPDIEKNINRFDYLKKSNVGDVSKYLKLSKDSETFEKKILRAERMYSGNSFFRRDEFLKTSRKLKKSLRQVKSNLVSDYILFFTTEGVPNYTMMNILYEVGILQDNGIKIRTRQYLQGIPNDFKSYMFDKKDYFNRLTKKERKKILPNFKLKLDPRFFKEFNLTKAPAIALATCKGINPTINNCNFKYLIRGDSSLTNFFDKIKEKDKKYENHYNYLIANKIFNPGEKK